MPSFLRNFAFFLLSVFNDFRANKGFLLASALAYNALLSLIPLCILLLVALSLFFDQQQIAQIVRTELAFVVPGHADWLTEAVLGVVDQRGYVGGAVVSVLLFFAGVGFRTFEDAMEVIFHRRGPDMSRHFVASALIPYVFIVVLGIAVIGLTILTGLTDSLAGRTLHVFRWEFAIAPLSGIVLYVSGFLGLIGMFASLYKVMPVKKIDIRHALIGGVTVALLWEIARRIIVWYFSSVSVVNVVYGSLTSVIVVLLTMEVASVILLIGAQVIAELDENVEAGLPWHGVLPEAEQEEDEQEEEEDDSE